MALNSVRSLYQQQEKEKLLENASLCSLMGEVGATTNNDLDFEALICYRDKQHFDISKSDHEKQLRVTFDKNRDQSTNALTCIVSEK